VYKKGPNGPFLVLTVFETSIILLEIGKIMKFKTAQKLDDREKPSDVDHLAILALIVVISIIRAFVISKMWGWYVVPQFHVTELSLPIAFGFSILVAYLIPFQRKSSDDSQTLFNPFGDSLIQSLSVLFLGWIGTNFM
jgi:membrane protein YdbS with pleckstrin-like domain